MLKKMTRTELAASIARVKAQGRSAEGQEVIRTALQESVERCRERRANRPPITYIELMTEHYPL